MYNHNGTVAHVWHMGVCNIMSAFYWYDLDCLKTHVYISNHYLHCDWLICLNNKIEMNTSITCGNAPSYSLFPYFVLDIL